MKTRTKKLLAKELLIFIGVIFIFGLLYLLTYGYEQHKIDKTDELQQKILANKEILSKHRNESYENLRTLWKDLANKIDGFTIEFTYFIEDMQDSTNRITLHSNLTKGFPNTVYPNFSKTYEQFSSELGFDNTLDTLIVNNQNLQVDIDKYSEWIDGFKLFRWIVIGLLILIYPIRYTVYATSWAFRTLKE